MACLSMLLVSCLPTGPSEWNDLRRHLECWEARRPPTYEFVLQRSCGECLPEWTTPMRIMVHERQIRWVVNLQTGELVPADTHRAKSIEDLFALVERALEQRAYRVSVSYDRDLGYPTSIFIDYDRQMVDDEIDYSVQELRAVH